MANDRKHRIQRWAAKAYSILLTGSVVCIVGMVCHFASAQDKNANTAQFSAASETKAAVLTRGKYIVEDLAVCTQCHTPRDFQGNLDKDEWLEGAALWLQPARPMEDWPLKAPRIAGNPPGTDAEMVKLLTTGIWRDGKPLRAPMPQFRMSAADAVAVVAYLKSLNSQH
jgi:mono/diheme cytochrome c family protein